MLEEGLGNIPEVSNPAPKVKDHVKGSKYFDNFYITYNKSSALKIVFTKSNFKLIFTKKPENLSWKDSWKTKTKAFLCKFKEAYLIADIINILLKYNSFENFPKGWNTIVHFPDKNDRKITTTVTFSKVVREKAGKMDIKYAIIYHYPKEDIKISLLVDKYELLLIKNILTQNVPRYAIKYNQDSLREK